MPYNKYTMIGILQIPIDLYVSICIYVCRHFWWAKTVVIKINEKKYNSFPYFNLPTVITRF